MLNQLEMANGIIAERVRDAQRGLDLKAQRRQARAARRSRRTR
jgi:hypothetical protein